jgi:hypothetical protein
MLALDFGINPWRDWIVRSRMLNSCPRPRRRPIDESLGGAMQAWFDPLIADHAIGLELQIREWIVRRERARREGWMDEVHAAELEIVALELELADVADQTTHEPPPRPIVIRGADAAGQVVRRPKLA